jgi:integrase
VPGTKNAQSHQVWLSEPVRGLLTEVIATPASTDLMQREMRAICTKLRVNDKVTPHDLRRTFCSRVTALEFGREAMNRVTNHKEGGIADVYDRHQYREENRKIMESVARHLITIAEADAANVVTFGR